MARIFMIIVVQLLLTTLPFPTLAQASSSESLYASDQLLLALPRDNPTSAASEFERSLHRSEFPKDFIFGSGTSAYQVEGAASEDGKGISIWDTWAHAPGHILNGQTGDVAVDQYDRYEEDIDLIAAMNMDSYRFSIAWTRIFPNGTGPQVNVEGVAYYNRLIDALLSKGIKPFVTLYHWDLPQTLQDAYDGWLSHQIVNDFAAYAKVCFEAFGDRVKHWTTFNEPGQFLHGYGAGVKVPPGRTAHPSTEPYLAAHNVLLAHAAAVDIYRRTFQEEQEGVIGFSVDIMWGTALTNSTQDMEAAERYNIFQTGWFLDPLYFGDYPPLMREYIGSRLPEFSQDQVLLLKGSLDFIGLNYYTSRWVSEGPGPSPNKESSVSLDQHVTTMDEKDGVTIGPLAASKWLAVVPWGLYDLLKFLSQRYNAPIIVTENGFDYKSDLPMEDALLDTTRVQFFHDHLSMILNAIRDGVDVRGYFAWSLLDNFEWSLGYSLRFGLVFVDFNDGLKRYPKDSARWFAQILGRRQLDS